jgi:hypothetical protein
MGSSTILYLLLLYVILAISGFFAAKRLNKCMAIVYLVTLSIMIMMRIVIMIYLNDTMTFILYVIIIIIEIMIGRWVFRFIKALGILNPEQLCELRPYVRCC